MRQHLKTASRGPETVITFATCVMLEVQFTMPLLAKDGPAEFVPFVGGRTIELHSVLSVRR